MTGAQRAHAAKFSESAMMRPEGRKARRQQAARAVLSFRSAPFATPEVGLRRAGGRISGGGDQRRQLKAAGLGVRG